MRKPSKFITVSALIVFGILGFGCAQKTTETARIEPNKSAATPAVISKKDDPLIIIGEGGPSRGLFVKAAQTYQKKHGGLIYEVDSGDGFIEAVKDFSKNHGDNGIQHLEYFGHGNSVGLFVNQQARVNGGLYANDPALNKSYSAASIYELPETVFQPNATIQFNGCNVAQGYPEKDTLAQRVANYFQVKVIAPKGPTEFSKSQDRVDPINHANYVSSNFSGDLYMVPTYKVQGFIEIEPQAQSDSRFTDVHRGEMFDRAVRELVNQGLDLNFQNKKFLPYKLITYREAQKFCRIVTKDPKACSVAGYKDTDRIRNLHALKMLVDAKPKPQTLKPTSPWHNAYISWATTKNVLTTDFSHKKWYTRGEMAELTWNILKLQE